MRKAEFVDTIEWPEEPHVVPAATGELVAVREGVAVGRTWAAVHRAVTPR